MICTAVIIVGKMFEQSWKIFKFSYFAYIPHQDLKFLNLSRLKAEIFTFICTVVIIVGKIQLDALVSSLMCV